MLYKQIVLYCVIKHLLDSARPCAEHCRGRVGVTLFKELIGAAYMSIILCVSALLVSREIVHLASQALSPRTIQVHTDQ